MDDGSPVGCLTDCQDCWSPETLAGAQPLSLSLEPQRHLGQQGLTVGDVQVYEREAWSRGLLLHARYLHSAQVSQCLFTLYNCVHYVVSVKKFH